jgi:hypothetical protein
MPMNQFGRCRATVHNAGGKRPGSPTRRGDMEPWRLAVESSLKAMHAHCHHECDAGVRLVGQGQRLSTVGRCGAVGEAVQRYHREGGSRLTTQVVVESFGSPIGQFWGQE